ncbi:MAG TPA: carboxypeptidase regulatory-like domain-containing protein [Anaerolineales bacterium]|nr:carboxypeptidase regulatory-like domain-containing protein [Anaerolineales bacterium]
MRSKRLFQIFVLFVLLFSLLGSSPRAYASTTSQADAVVINRSLNYWDATYIGFVSASIFENWQFEFAESHNFVVTVSPVSGDLIPLLTLLDTNGNELAHGTGTLTSTQPAGSYSVQVQPQSGSGFYVLTIRQIVTILPSVSTVVSPASVNAGETATVTVSLNNVPAEGYTSAEFTCTYNAGLVEAGNIVVGNLFGADPAVAINGPQNGSFIVAIAGSNGNKATTSGATFTFSATGLQAGQTAIECTVRVSKGDSVLTSLSSTGPAALTITGGPTFTPTPTGSVVPPTDTFTPTPTGSVVPPTDTFTPTPTGSVVPPTDTFTPTPTGSVVPPTDTFTPTPTGSVVPPTDTFTPTPTASATPTSTETVTSTPVPTTGTLTGQVLASKTVTVSLLNADNSVAASMTANADGTFSLTAPAGTYAVRAAASGFLSAQGSTTLTAGNTNTMPTISLLPGDIDNNNVIDQLDALTIGMSYNTASPAAADLNNDGIINVLDLELLAQNYRKTGPVAWQ